MLWDLKVRDIADFHPRSRIPQTSALAQQKLQSLDIIDGFWYNSLCTGMIGSELPVVGDWEEGGTVAFACDDVRNAFEDHAKKMGDRFFGRRSMETQLGQRLKRHAPSLAKRRVRCPEERQDLAVKGDGRIYVYTVPSLGECRKLFEDMVGCQLNWSPLEADDEYVDLDANVEDLD
jgi:hypothetical protein